MSISEIDDPFHIYAHYAYPLEITCTIPKKDYLKIAWHFFWHLAPRTLVLFIITLVPFAMGFFAAIVLPVLFGYPAELKTMFWTTVIAIVDAILYFLYIVYRLGYFGHSNCPKGLKRTYSFNKGYAAIYENNVAIDSNAYQPSNIFEKGEYLHFATYGHGFGHILYCIPIKRIPHDFYLFLTEDRTWESHHPINEN